MGFAAVTPYKTLRGTLPSTASVFTAELHAIETALNYITERRETEWTIFTDSQSSLMEIEKYKTDHPITQNIHSLTTKLQNHNKRIIFCKVPSHIGIMGNELADTAAKEATEMPGLHTETVPYKDYFQHIKKYRNKKWQEQWNNSTTKLKRIKPTIKHWISAYNTDRSIEVKLARLRIGHTRLTHGHYMEKRAAPTCTYCPNKNLTVEHLLTECGVHRHTRETLRLPKKLEELLGEDCPIEKLYRYLTLTGLYKLI